MKKSNLLIVLLSLVFCLSANAGEKIYFVHTDQLGTPHALTDDAQNTVWKVGDDPFGNATPAVADIANNIRFPGQYFDVESGLHYNWNRYYDPNTGRYITSDPIGLLGGLNSFSYAKNNAIRYYDYLGLSPVGRWDEIIPIFEGDYIASSSDTVFVFGYGYLEATVICSEENDCGEIEEWPVGPINLKAPDALIDETWPDVYEYFVFDGSYNHLWSVHPRVQSEINKWYAQDPTMFCFR